MSGGSFDYLCDRVGSVSEYDRLADALRQQGVPAYSKTRKDLEKLVELMEKAEELRQQLAPVIKAVEWCCSGDTDADDTRKACKAYERAQRNKKRW